MRTTDFNKKRELDRNRLYEEICEDPNPLINRKDLADRFISIDNFYNHRPWTIVDILANISILVGEQDERKNFV